LRSVKKDADDRIVTFRFVGTDELGNTNERVLIAQLTGRSANLFLADRAGVITLRARSTRVPGQEIGHTYQKPSIVSERRIPKREGELVQLIRSDEFSSASDAADAYFSSLLSRQAFDVQAANARSELQKKITRQQKLLQQLQKDLASHDDAEQNKRIGDLLLANLGTAKRNGNRVILADYFADDAPAIEIEIDEKTTLPEEASRRFALYSRSKRAVRQINSRI